MPWAKYKYGNSPALVPLGDGTDAPWPSDAQIRLAGFDPADEEMSVTRLRRPWNGHPRGAVVLTGLAVEGHPFAVRYQWGRWRQPDVAIIGGAP